METKHIARLDSLRIIGAFMIVGCHLVFVSPDATAVGVLRRFTDFFVGIFGMLAGFLMCRQLVRKEVSYAQFASKRVSRLLLPYLVWSVFFVCANCVFDFLLHKPLTFDIWSGKDWLYILVAGSAGPHTWFLIALFYGQIILYYPIRLLSKKSLGWVLLMCMGLVALSITVWSAEHALSWSGIGIYHVRLLAYLAFGAALSLVYPAVQYNARLFPKIAHVLWFVWLIVACVMFQTLDTVNGFWLAAWISFPIFVWALIGDNSRVVKGGVIKQVAAVSMGIYCIHPIFTALLHTALARMHVAVGDAVILADWVVCWALAWGCATVMSQNSYLKRLVT